MHLGSRSFQAFSGRSVPRIHMNMQDTWRMLIRGDTDGGLTAVAVGIAKLGEPAVLATQKEASSFMGTGRALSAAAGRLSYVHGLKVPAVSSSWESPEAEPGNRAFIHHEKGPGNLHIVQSRKAAHSWLHCCGSMSGMFSTGWHPRKGKRAAAKA